MTKNGALMPDTSEYDEEWTVTTTDKGQFTLNEKQVEMIRQADGQGMRGMVHFKDFSISIPHIISMYRTSRKLKIVSQLLESGQTRELTEDEKLRAEVARIRIRRDLERKGIIHKTTSESDDQSSPVF